MQYIYMKPLYSFKLAYFVSFFMKTISSWNVENLMLLLDRCSNTAYLNRVHALIIVNGLHQSFALVAKLLLRLSSSPSSHCLSEANLVYPSAIFAQVHRPNVFIWNTLFKSYSKSANPLYALLAYCSFCRQGLRPDSYTFPPLLEACTELNYITHGLQILTHVVKTGLNSNIFTQTQLLRCLATGGCVGEARKVFDEMVEMGFKDSVAWTAMICAYTSEHGDIDEAFRLFKDMPFERDIVCWNSMITGFVKWGEIIRARELFEKNPHRDDVVCWSAMIGGYVQRGDFKEALKLFNRMRESSAKPNRITLVSALCASAQLGSIRKGMSIHEYIEKNGIYMDMYIGTTLVEMYAKCGHIRSSIKVFHMMLERDVYTWNTMIEGFAVHGQASDALDMFSRMREEGLEPNEVTFVGVLTACRHMGLVKEAKGYFDSMVNEYGITPRIEHYGCMVDLLGRAGFIDEAEEMVNTMPFKPNAVVWGALLGASKLRGNVELGERALKHLLYLEPQNGANYILLSNIYAAADRWEDVEKIREMMRASGIKKIYGFSYVEIGGLVYEFIQGDKSLSKDVYRLLDKLADCLREMGHIPITGEVLHDVEEEEKKNALSWHSEKLAVAFGILNTSSGSTLMIVKNLRMCQDCHSAFKLVSRIFNRMIIVRDRIRFHHFIGGVCSCKDFW